MRILNFALNNTYQAPEVELGEYRDRFEEIARKLGPKFWPNAKKFAGGMLPRGHDRLFRTPSCEAEITRHLGAKFCADMVSISVCPFEVDESIDSGSWPEVIFYFAKPKRWGSPAPDFHIWYIEGDPKLCLSLAEKFLEEFSAFHQVSY